jgi:hypothetical protein
MPLYEAREPYCEPRGNRKGVEGQGLPRGKMIVGVRPFLPGDFYREIEPGVAWPAGARGHCQVLVR